MSYELINIVEESANPLSSPLWPKKIVEQLMRGYEKGKPYYLQTGGWQKLWGGNNGLPCMLNQDGKTQKAVSHGLNSAGKQKVGKHQYPTILGMDIHRLTALVMIPNPDPENLREVDHINDINCAHTAAYACALHELFGAKVDVDKICWLPINLRWRSSSDNGTDSTSEEHEEFKEKVPVLDLNKYSTILSEEEKRKPFFEVQQNLLERNNNHREHLADWAEDQSYYEHLKDFVVNYRNYSKEDYKWLVDHVSQLGDDYINKLPDSIMWDVLRLENFNNELRKLPNPVVDVEAIWQKMLQNAQNINSLKNTP